MHNFDAVNDKFILGRYEKIVRGAAAERGVTVVEMTPEFTSITSEMFYVDDRHPSEYGREFIARKIAETLSPFNVSPVEE